jgi:hypothetical protein
MMRRHELDPVSLVFGFAFTAAGTLFLAGRVDQAVRLRWLWPVLLLALGLGILLDLNTRRPEASAAPSAAPDEAVAPSAAPDEAEPVEAETAEHLPAEAEPVDAEPAEHLPARTAELEPEAPPPDRDR